MPLLPARHRMRVLRACSCDTSAVCGLCCGACVRTPHGLVSLQRLASRVRVLHGTGVWSPGMCVHMQCHRRDTGHIGDLFKHNEYVADLDNKYFPCDTPTAKDGDEGADLAAEDMFTILETWFASRKDDANVERIMTNFFAKLAVGAEQCPNGRLLTKKLRSFEAMMLRLEASDTFSGIVSSIRLGAGASEDKVPVGSVASNLVGVIPVAKEVRCHGRVQCGIRR